MSSGYSGKKAKNTNQKVTPPGTNNLSPTFDFSGIHSKYSFSSMDAKQINCFFDTLVQLSQITWMDILGTHKGSKFGNEPISRSTLRKHGFSNYPASVSDNDEIIAFRYAAPLRMIGVRKERSFVILGIANNIDDFYKH